LRPSLSNRMRGHPHAHPSPLRGRGVGVRGLCLTRGGKAWRTTATADQGVGRARATPSRGSVTVLPSRPSRQIRDPLWQDGRRHKYCWRNDLQPLRLPSRQNCIMARRSLPGPRSCVSETSRRFSSHKVRKSRWIFATLHKIVNPGGFRRTCYCLERLLPLEKPRRPVPVAAFARTRVLPHQAAISTENPLRFLSQSAPDGR
jgi:hypothetical protein